MMEIKQNMLRYERPMVESVALSSGLHLLTNFSLDAVIDDYNEGLDIIYSETQS